MDDKRFTMWANYYDAIEFNDDKTRLKKLDALMKYGLRDEIPADKSSEEYSFIQSIKPSIDRSKTYHMEQSDRAGAGRKVKLTDDVLTDIIIDLKSQNEKLTMDNVLIALSKFGINVTRSTVEKRDPWRHRNEIEGRIDWNSFSTADF